MKLTEMKQVLAKRGIQLTKSLGQNFLHDANQLRRILAAAELKPTDRVLEIGPGLGPLTEMLVAQVGEVLLYGAGVFGVVAAATGGSRTSFARPWVSAALVVFVVMVGLLHGLVRPAERRYRAAMLELAQAPAMAPPARPPQLAELDRLYRRIGVGMGLFNILLLGVIYLMVFKP